jgi:hypothetical protein
MRLLLRYREERPESQKKELPHFEKYFWGRTHLPLRHRTEAGAPYEGEQKSVAYQNIRQLHQFHP